MHCGELKYHIWFKILGSHPGGTSYISPGRGAIFQGILFSLIVFSYGYQKEAIFLEGDIFVRLARCSVQFLCCSVAAQLSILFTEVFVLLHYRLREKFWSRVKNKFLHQIKFICQSALGYFCCSFCLWAFMTLILVCKRSQKYSFLVSVEDELIRETHVVNEYVVSE